MQVNMYCYDTDQNSNHVRQNKIYVYIINWFCNRFWITNTWRFQSICKYLIFHQINLRIFQYENWSSLVYDGVFHRYEWTSNWIASSIQKYSLTQSGIEWISIYENLKSPEFHQILTTANSILTSITKKFVKLRNFFSICE